MDYPYNPPAEDIILSGPTRVESLSEHFGYAFTQLSKMCALHKLNDIKLHSQHPWCCEDDYNPDLLGNYVVVIRCRAGHIRSVLAKMAPEYCRICKITRSCDNKFIPETQKYTLAENLFIFRCEFGHRFAIHYNNKKPPQVCPVCNLCNIAREVHGIDLSINERSLYVSPSSRLRVHYHINCSNEKRYHPRADYEYAKRCQDYFVTGEMILGTNPAGPLCCAKRHTCNRALSLLRICELMFDRPFDDNMPRFGLSVTCFNAEIGLACILAEDIDSLDSLEEFCRWCAERDYVVFIGRHANSEVLASNLCKRLFGKNMKHSDRFFEKLGREVKRRLSGATDRALDVYIALWRYTKDCNTRSVMFPCQCRGPPSGP